MCKALRDIQKHAERQGIKIGERQGEKKGEKKGETRLATLMESLFADGRTEDARLASTDEKARKRFYQEYGIV